MGILGGRRLDGDRTLRLVFDRRASDADVAKPGHRSGVWQPGGYRDAGVEIEVTKAATLSEGLQALT